MSCTQHSLPFFQRMYRACVVEYDTVGMISCFDVPLLLHSHVTMIQYSAVGLFERLVQSFNIGYMLYRHLFCNNQNYVCMQLGWCCNCYGIFEGLTCVLSASLSDDRIKSPLGRMVHKLPPLLLNLSWWLGLKPQRTQH